VNPTSKLNPLAYMKAIAGAVIAGLGVLYIALSDDRVTAQEAVAVVSASLSAFATVWGIPNAPTKETVSKSTVTVETSQVPVPEQVAAVEPAPAPFVPENDARG
jgi:hypothetical protein